MPILHIPILTSPTIISDLSTTNSFGTNLSSCMAIFVTIRRLKLLLKKLTYIKYCSCEFNTILYLQLAPCTPLYYLSCGYACFSYCLPMLLFILTDKESARSEMLIAGILLYRVCCGSGKF